ncbi:MAG: site-specific integrase, partial [Caldilineaceae bacterium]|nr:site-specific integrase [Caldilineaceae bacterium]
MPTSSSAQPPLATEPGAEQANGSAEINQPSVTEIASDPPAEAHLETNAETNAEQSAPPPLRADSQLRQAIAAFTEYMLRKGFSENTIKAFRNDLKILAGFMGEETRLHQIKTEHLNEFLEWMQSERGKPCSAKTLARRITTLKVFFGWLHGIGVIGTDPAEPVVQQSVRTPLPTILRDSEVNQLLLTAQDMLWHRQKPDARPYLLVS